MKSPDNVEFRDRLGVSGSRGLEGFFKRHGVGARRVLLAAESAEPARGHANIRRIDVAIDVEICLITVHALANRVRHPTKGENVPGAVKTERV